MKRGQESRTHPVGNRVVLLDSCLCLAVRADVVREVAARAQYDLDGVGETCSGKNLGYNVVPCRARAGKHDGRALKSILSHKPSGDINRTLKELPNGVFVIQHPFIDLDPA